MIVIDPQGCSPVTIDFNNKERRSVARSTTQRANVCEFNYSFVVTGTQYTYSCEKRQLIRYKH